MTDPQPPVGPQWGPIPEPHQSVQAPAPKRRRRWPWIAGGVFAVIMIAGGIGNLVSPPTLSNTPVTTRVVATSTVAASTTTAVSVTALTAVPVTTPVPVMPTLAPPVVTTTLAPPPVVTTTVVPPPPAVATTQAPSVPAPVAVQLPPPVTGGTSCGADTYVNSDGICVRRPISAAAPPPGATARCNDGTYSSSTHRSGTCSSHGGVAAFL